MLLEQLSNAVGVSGDEGAVRKIVLDAIKDHVTDIEIDSIGNVTAFKKGTGESNLRVMLAAHMDEIGFMITGYDNNGFLKFTNVGGVDDRILPGQRLTIGEKGINGVITWPPIHRNQDQNVKKLKDLRIDIGASNKKAAEGKVKQGSRATFATQFSEINDVMVRGKAFDDRVGCSLLIDLIQGEPFPVDLVIAFTVQEEVGLRGALVAAQRLNPDVAFALEGTTAHDIPDPMQDPDDLTVRNPACKIGSGPVLTVMDKGMITQPKLLNFLRETAENAHIPYQLKTALGGRTDAANIHTSNAGIPSATVSMPCRYIHSPMAYLSREDYIHFLDLMQAALKNLTPDAITVD